MKYSKKEWINALIYGFVFGTIAVVVGCLLLKWFREGGYVWFGFECPAASVRALIDTAVTL